MVSVAHASFGTNVLFPILISVSFAGRLIYTNSANSLSMKRNVIPKNNSVAWKDKCNAMLCDIGKDGFIVNTTACSKNDNPRIKTSKSSTVKIVTTINPTEKHVISCLWVITKMENHYINLTMVQLTDDFIGNFTLTFSEIGETNDFLSQAIVDTAKLKNITFSFSSDKSIQVLFESQEPHSARVVTLHVHIIKGPHVRDLPFVMLSDNVGYVTSPGYDDVKNYPDNYDGVFNLHASDEDLVIISFFNFIVGHEYVCKRDYLQITGIERNIKETHCGWKQKLIIEEFRSSVALFFHTDDSGRFLGFKIMFAIVPESRKPQKLRSNRFNCSMPNFQSFKLLFSCNMLVECEGGEDEQDCFDRNNECGKVGAVDAGTKCYSVVILHKRSVLWSDAHKNCIRRGQNLATFGNQEDFRKFKVLLRPVINLRPVFIGAQLMKRFQAVSIVALYRNIWQWVDGRSVFSTSIKSRRFYVTRGTCAEYYPWYQYVDVVECSQLNNWAASVCEFYKYGEDPYTRAIGSIINNESVSSLGVIWKCNVVECPSGHVTRDFLFCDYQTDCGGQYTQKSCSIQGVTVPMFQCLGSQFTVHYTLVCDHMQHCPNNSDEDFCENPECPPSSFRCRGGQCFYNYQMCDGKLDCYDGSDEVCMQKILSVATFPPPGSVYLDGSGNFRVEPMNGSSGCPPTHFLCPRGLCLPLYLRCNGIVDCSGYEDEVGCDSYKCPGFYRCRGSKVCLQAQDVCDSVPQCPQQDDELVCGLCNCPNMCRCQGLAFVCTSYFPVMSYNIAIRYLDASGSSTTLTDVSDNIHLIALRLSKCQIRSMPMDMRFPNLMTLDLSWNELYRLHMQCFNSLGNLRVLILIGNPLVQITGSKSSESAAISLEHVDLSHTHLEEFDGSAFVNSPHIRSFNISWSKLRMIAESGFQVTPRLENFDATGSHLSTFPKNLLTSLKDLKTVHVEYYKLCCDVMLPVNFNPKNCHSKQDVLASCEDLLKSSTYRVLLWIFSSLSLAGNVFSIVVRFYFPQEDGPLGSFSLFVTNLSAADFLMGVYLAIIGMADIVYRGHYLWRDEEWKKSASCNIAGFLCLFSSEASVFMFCLVTVDRLLVIRFPSGRFRFGKRSALAACGCVWVAALCLATVPLLPRTRHWEFYGQTGICIPLPFDNSDIFLGYDYFFSVLIILNLALFLVIVVGQAAIYKATERTTSINIPLFTNKWTKDAVLARHLIAIVASDFLCWFQLGIMGLLAFTGILIPADLKVAMAIIALPCNSAINPFLYTFNLLTERHKNDQTERILKRLGYRK